MEKLKIYLDITGKEKYPSDFKPFTDERPHPDKGRRFCFTVKLPPMEVTK
jgi:hypothetical protein